MAAERKQARSAQFIAGEARRRLGTSIRSSGTVVHNE